MAEKFFAVNTAVDNVEEYDIDSIKVELEELVFIISEALKEEGANCSVYKVAEEMDKPHKTIFEIRLSPDEKITFSKSEAVMRFTTGTSFDLDEIDDILDELTADPYTQFSDYQCVVQTSAKEYTFSMRDMLEGGAIESELSVSRRIKYNLDSCNFAELMSEFMCKHLFFASDINLLKKLLLEYTGK